MNAILFPLNGLSFLVAQHMECSVMLWSHQKPVNVKYGVRWYEAGFQIYRHNNIK
jgi:hypothetical protein